MRLALLPLCSAVLFWAALQAGRQDQPPPGPQERAEAAARVFAKQCYACHNDTDTEGGLNMQTYEALLRGGKKGPAIVPGNSEDSRLVQMIEGFEEPMMPEDGFLLDEDIQVIRSWVDAGAPAWSGDLARLKLEDLPEIPLRADIQPEIASLDFSPDGKILAAGSYQEVLLLDPATRNQKARLSGHVHTVRSVSFSPDGRLLAAAGGIPSRYGEVKIWDLSRSLIIQTLEGHNDCIYSSAFSPDGRYLATSSYDRTVKLWDVSSGQELRTFKGHVDAVYDVQFFADGLHLASASADRTVKIWNVQSGQQAFNPLSESTGELFTLALHPGGRLVAAAGADKMIRIWRLTDTGGELVQSAFAHDSPILRLAFTPDGATLVSAGSDRLVKFWDIEKLQEIKVLEKQPDWVLSLAISPGGRLLATGRYDGAVEIYTVKANETL